MTLENVVANLAQQAQNRYFAKYRGVVVDNADPEQLGRLKVQVPSVLGTEIVTGWAMPCVPYGGDMNQGMLFIPEVGAGVWIEFEEGNLEYPIWVGTFWRKPGGDSQVPKPNDPDGAEQGSVQDPPTRKIIKTLKGHTLQFEDNDGEESIILIEAVNNHVVTMNQDGIKITDGNNNIVTMDANGTKIEDANGNTTTMDASGTKIEDSNGNSATMDASGVTLEGPGGNQVIIGASGVKVGSTSAVEPFVLGLQFNTQVTSFLTSLGTHTHVGNLGAPTSPPVAPIMLQVPLSSKHMVE